ncbi:haloacid dehalogenase type II [Alkalicoccus halolimnae]|uniref:Haloacid dehalogenase type II n=1 Tax=Alkalicoccus halolimnae TaxID=1667239 RepID=A0A5C7FBX3_9BACI|nr:haloacid dehalogenase type II [Alkalicoccus halolimnae]TXF81849.1 haloacid dehalogenase type II [Alkalicoccus halolimnae]
MVQSDLRDVKAVLFDVFGTVVDFRSTIKKEGAVWNSEKELDIDWGAFADAWRAQYHPNMQRVMSGELEWNNLDSLHKMALSSLLERWGVKKHFSEKEIEVLNQVWHRLDPWSDSVHGLEQIKEHFTISPLSNGNMSLLTNMAKQSGLPWDVILSPELIKSYKPDPKVYYMAADYLGLNPHQIMMTACHQYDLQAAQKLGFRTGYVMRPFEFGYEHIPDLTPLQEYDITAYDLVDLSEQLRRRSL